MAIKHDLLQLGITAGDITPMACLRNTPPPVAPFTTIADHLGPAPEATVQTATAGWNNIMNFEPGM